MRFSLLLPGADNNMQFDSVFIQLPDITLCRFGLPKKVHLSYDRLEFTELFIKTLYRNLTGIDKLRTKYYFLARSQFSRHENFSQEHIGQYLLFCTYKGYKCDYRNFTLYRDPFFSNCFTFTPRSREILKAGKVLSIGLYVNRLVDV